MSAGSRTAVVSPYVVALGVRYMFNNKFGLKLTSVTIAYKW
jgi:OOP family OmpA-OmpF porin